MTVPVCDPESPSMLLLRRWSRLGRDSLFARPAMQRLAKDSRAIDPMPLGKLIAQGYLLIIEPQGDLMGAFYFPHVLDYVTLFGTLSEIVQEGYHPFVGYLRNPVRRIMSGK
jgi:hypothetical protein